MVLLFPVQARELAGVKLPDSVTIADTHSTLTLNGAGIRKKLFIKIYVEALYLAQPTKSAEQTQPMRPSGC
jgi:hypothetical protein